MPANEYNDYSDTAQALAAHRDDDEPDPLRQSNSRSPAWSRRSPDSNRRHTTGSPSGWLQKAEHFGNQGIRLWWNLTPVQRTAFVVVNIILFVLGVLFLVYHQSILHSIAPVVKSWRHLKAGWLILWGLTFAVSFPPMIGYSTCVTLAGLVYGMKGWFIVASATVVGSTCSFLVSRTVLKSFVSRLTSKDKRFAALSLVLKHDGIKLLIMIRLCPLPYSISNGAISTIPTVTPLSFMIATAIATPKLLLHIFVGSRLGELAENGDKMDTKTKIVSYISILIGIAAGILTGYFIYVRTKARAAALEAEETEAAMDGSRTSDLDADYIDDPDEQAAVDALRREDDISLHQTYDDDLEGGHGYRDDSPDHNARSNGNVFDVGDGETDDEDQWKRKR